MSQFDNVSVLKKANVYLDGRPRHGGEWNERGAGAAAAPPSAPASLRSVTVMAARISHTVVLASGERKSVGVMLPATLHFTTGAPEVMELIAGRCRVTLAGEVAARDYVGGQSFEVAGDSSFDIEVTEALHYVCHFG